MEIPKMIINMKYSRQFMHIPSFNDSVVHECLLLRNEEKPVALLVYSSFIRVGARGFRMYPYSLVVLTVFRDEEKLVAILVYSSVKRVATSVSRIIP